MKYSYFLITMMIAITSNNVLSQTICPKADEWNNNCYAKYTFEDGSVYEGQWHNNKPNGIGTYTFGPESEHAGDEYLGEFKHGLRYGLGSYAYKNGDK